MPRFVIHEHFAKRHHFDLRLEIKGVLESWAVPKTLPRKSGVRRLCIQVEPHHLDYIDFEGEIPKGMYGAGKVLIWDNGNYDIVSRHPKKIILDFHGKKLKGEYVLVKFKKAGEKSWLFFKKKAE